MIQMLQIHHRKVTFQKHQMSLTVEAELVQGQTQMQQNPRMQIV